MRRSHDHIKIHPVGNCDHCGESRFPHHMCLNCGYYKGRKVFITKAERRSVKRDTEEK